MRFVLRLGTLAALLAGLPVTGSVMAADISILSGGAAKAGLADAIPLFEKATGDKAAID